MRGRMNYARRNEAQVERPYSASRNPRRRSRPRTRSRSRRISRSPLPQLGKPLANPLGLVAQPEGRREGPGAAASVTPQISPRRSRSRTRSRSRRVSRFPPQSGACLFDASGSVTNSEIRQTSTGAAAPLSAPHMSAGTEASVGRNSLIAATKEANTDLATSLDFSVL